MTSPRRPGFWSRTGEEGIVERTAKTYFLSAVAGTLALIGLAFWYAYLPASWWMSCLIGAGLLLLLARMAGGDEILTVWWRWPIIAKDCGLLANETGVPDLLWVRASQRICTAIISALAVPTMDAIEMEDAVARGLGYGAGVIKEVSGRVRKSRVRWELTMYRDNVMTSTIPVRFDACLDANTDEVFLGCDKALQPVTVNLMETAGHWIIQGATRGGKTAFMYGVLAQVASMRNVVCRIVDPTGIVALPFSAFDENSVVPYPGSTGNGRFAELALFLEEEVRQMDLRIADLVKNWQDNVAEVTPELPLRMIVIEEYAGVLAAADAEDAVGGRKRAQTRSRIEAALARLTAEGAKAAIRVVLMTQRASARIVDTDTRGNFAVRISFRVEATESLNMLHDDLGPEWVTEIKGYKNGVGVCQLPGDPIRKFRAGLLADEGNVGAGVEPDPLFKLFTKRILGALEVSEAAVLERDQSIQREHERQLLRLLEGADE